MTLLRDVGLERIDAQRGRRDTGEGEEVFRADDFRRSQHGPARPRSWIVGLVAENVFTNFLNNVAQTDIDFPVVRTVGAA